jgi:hypothetical protein
MKNRNNFFEDSNDGDITLPTKRLNGFSTAQGLADFIREELMPKKPDYDHLIRALTTEVYRWFMNKFTDEELEYVSQEPTSCGDIRWDALLESIVLYYYMKYNITPPKWAYMTKLKRPFSPRDYRTTRYAAQIRILLDTPTFIWNKGIYFSESEMDLV